MSGFKLDFFPDRIPKNWTVRFWQTLFAIFLNFFNRKMGLDFFRLQNYNEYSDIIVDGRCRSVLVKFWLQHGTYISCVFVSGIKFLNFVLRVFDILANL